MSRPRLVVHAHFYQPFRTDPFTGHVPGVSVNEAVRGNDRVLAQREIVDLAGRFDQASRALADAEAALR